MRQAVSILCLVFTVLAPFSARGQVAPTVFAGFEHLPTGTAALAVDPAFAALSIVGLVNSSGGVEYQLDAEGGTIRFGDGIRGARPASGSWSVNAQYRVGGGIAPSIDGDANAVQLDLVFDYLSLTNSAVHAVYQQGGGTVLEEDSPPLLPLVVDVWPAELTLLIDQGEMILEASWDAPVQLLTPSQATLLCDHVSVRSQTGGSLAGEELGLMSWSGADLGPVQILGERFREAGVWYEIDGDPLLTRTALGHELAHSVQQGPGGSSSQFPPSPCISPSSRNGVFVEQLNLPNGPEFGTRTESFQYMELPVGGRARIPTHSAEWTNLNDSDPGMTILGGFAELGALSYTVQIFRDGLLVDSETGLGAAVAHAKEYVLQYNQSDFDFLQQRASAQMDLGADVEIQILASVPRSVIGDRVHIVPEQLQLLPPCVEGAGIGMHKVSDITLKRGVFSAALPPARVFGLHHQAEGDAVLREQGGILELSNEYWGPSASGPLAGGVRTPVGGLQGFRWSFPGTMDPAQLSQDARRSFLLHLEDANGNAATAGSIAEIQNGQYAIGADFAALGAGDFDLEIWNGSQLVHAQVVPAQTKVLVAAAFPELEFLEDDQGIVSFNHRFDGPQMIDLGGTQLTGTRISERLRHRDRAVSIEDFESLAENTPPTQIHRASIRRHERWLSAVGEVDFGDPSADPLLLAHLDPLLPSGVETDDEEDPQGNRYASLRVEDPANINLFDGDEKLTLVIQEESPAGKLMIPSGSVQFQWQGAQWDVSVDFVAAGYSGFRVLADGAGQLYDSPSASAFAFSCAAFPVAQLVQGVEGDLSIRLSFAAPTSVDTPGLGPVSSDAVTLEIYGAGREPFASGHMQLLCEGLQSTAILPSLAPVAAPDSAPRRDEKVVLHPATPNPFNPRTELSFELASATEVTLTIFDLAGRRVRTLIDGSRPAGRASVVWDGRDERGRDVGSGLYFARLRNAESTAQQKLVLVR